MRPPIKKDGLYSHSKYLPTLLWNRFCSGQKDGQRCQSSSPALQFLWLHKISIHSEKLFFLLPPRVAHEHFSKASFFLLQHNLQTVLRACEFVRLPANQPCVGVRTGQVPVGKTAPFLKLFPLRVCRCSKGYNVLKCTFCYHPYNCQKVIVQNAMTYIHFILVSLIMLRWIHFLRTPPTPSPQASWVECTLNTQEWGRSKKPGLRVGGQTVLRCVDQPMKRETVAWKREVVASGPWSWASPGPGPSPAALLRPSHHHRWDLAFWNGTADPSCSETRHKH